MAGAAEMKPEKQNDRKTDARAAKLGAVTRVCVQISWTARSQKWALGRSGISSIWGGEPTSRCERSEGSLHVAAGGKRSLRRGKRRRGKRTPCRWTRKRTRPRPKSISSVKTHPERIREGLGHVWAVSGTQSSWTAHHEVPNERVRCGDCGVQELEFHRVGRRRP